jgi:hypothetical protein
MVVNGLKDAEKRFNKMISDLKLNPKMQIRASYRDFLLEKQK